MADHTHFVEFNCNSFVVYLASVVRAGLSYSQIEEIGRRNDVMPDIGWRYKYFFQCETSDMVKSLVGVYYEMLPSVLKAAWTFSIAVDGGDDGSGTSLMDVCVRVHVDGYLHNLHVAAIPMHCSHTGLYMYRIIDKVLLALDPLYRTKVVGVSTDGASSMTEALRGFVSYVRNAGLGSLYQVLRLVHRIELAINIAVKSFNDDEFGTGAGDDRIFHDLDFTSVLASVGTALRKHPETSKSIRSSCSVLIKVRWSSLEGLISWLTTHMGNRTMQTRLYRKGLGSGDNGMGVFWVITMCLGYVLRLVNNALAAVQNKTITMDETIAVYGKLCDDLEGRYGIVDYDPSDEPPALLDSFHPTMPDEACVCWLLRC
jgi:hypothetical protein